MLLKIYRGFTPSFQQKIIGIDLGTTNSVVAVMQGGFAIVVPNSEGNRSTPSVVSYTETKEVLVGELAVRQIITNVQNTFYSSKRLLGRTAFESNADEQFTDDFIEFAYFVVFGILTIEENSRRYGFTCPALGRIVSPEEVSAEILKKLARDASDYLGEMVDTIIITVPAYFNEAQRQATKDAALIAGLDVKRVLNEPTAAAMAWGLTNKKIADEGGYMLIFDLGGGTFDVSVMDYNDDIFEVLATSGNLALGGDDFDQVIVNVLIEVVEIEYGLEIEQQPMDEQRQAFQRVSSWSTELKVDLSTAEESSIRHPYIFPSVPIFRATLSRTEFEGQCAHLYEKVRIPVDSVFEDLKVEKKDEWSIKPKNISRTVLVGGSTRMPAIKILAEELMGKVPPELKNPDELVALGAALQGAVCNGELADVLLLDVTPLTLGIDTVGNVTQAIIPRQAPIPRILSEIFSTAEDDQQGVTIMVCQGERSTTTENKVLGTFELSGIRPARRGIPIIEVTFNLDMSGLLTVIALDKSTNKRQRINISGSSNLSTEAIEKIIREAERFQVDDNIKLAAVVTAQDAQIIADLARKVIDSKINLLNAKITEEVKSIIKFLEECLSDILKGDPQGQMLPEPEEIVKLSLKITRLNDILFTISEKE